MVEYPNLLQAAIRYPLKMQDSSGPLMTTCWTSGVMMQSLTLLKVDLRVAFFLLMAVERWSQNFISGKYKMSNCQYG